MARRTEGWFLGICAAGLLPGCCTSDNSLFKRIRDANDATLRSAVAAHGLTVVPVQVDHQEALAASADGIVNNSRVDHSVMVVASTYEGQEQPLPMVVRDASNVLHVIQPKPRGRIDRSYRLCGCPPGGGVPPPRTTWYVPLDDGAKVGEPLSIDVDQWLSAEATYSEQGPECAVPRRSRTASRDMPGILRRDAEVGASQGMA
jgi:hypothetical protein